MKDIRNELRNLLETTIKNLPEISFDMPEWGNEMEEKICSKNHDEICFSGLRCPVCALQDTINELEEALASAYDEIDDLEDNLP